MWFFLVACLFFVLCQGPSVFLAFKAELVFLQHKCFQFSPIDSSYERLWQALVCGRGLQSFDFWSQSLKASGLIHIFIVSGAHFLVLKFLLQKCRLPNWAINLCLWFFNAISGFTAPGTRACMQITTSRFFKLQHHQNLLASSLLCLCLNSSWIKSHSFWLSWLAGLILLASPKDPFRVMANCVFFSIWSLLGFALSLWSLVLNIVIAPLIGWLLFPLALLAFVPPFDQGFHLCLQLLESGLKFLNLETASLPVRFHAIPQISFLVLSVHTVWQIYHLSRQGRRIN